MFFETFVAMELVRQSEWADSETRLHHYRDKAQREVDVVLERNDGGIIGIEVKAAATVTTDDFRGLRFLRDKLGTQFKAGAVLYAATRHCRSVTASPQCRSQGCGQAEAPSDLCAPPLEQAPLGVVVHRLERPPYAARASSGARAAAAARPRRVQVAVVVERERVDELQAPPPALRPRRSRPRG